MGIYDLLQFLHFDLSAHLTSAGEGYRGVRLRVLVARRYWQDSRTGVCVVEFRGLWLSAVIVVWYREREATPC
jgi:hypothetical protein